VSPGSDPVGEHRWTAVVVNYNAGELLVPCVRSLLADRDADGHAPTVIVVDNASTDDSLARLSAAALPVTVMPAGGNVGYATAANRGIAVSATPIVAVCNPDLELHPGTGAALAARFAADARLGAVGPRVLNLDGTVYPSARAMPSILDAVGHGVFGLVWPGNRFTRRYRQLDADPNAAREVDWVSGAAIWLRREAIDAIGGWDENFFMYVEDVDVCWRLRRAGWRIEYDPAGEVVHRQGASTDQQPYRMIIEHHRSLWRFAKKRWTGGRAILLVPAFGYLVVRGGLALADRWWAGRRRMPTVAR
jgi:N-acetylglucosaminyl-diphospho-decaprenol L-rhamnosyltransferase